MKKLLQTNCLNLIPGSFGLKFSVLILSLFLLFSGCNRQEVNPKETEVKKETKDLKAYRFLSFTYADIHRFRHVSNGDFLYSTRREEIPYDGYLGYVYEGISFRVRHNVTYDNNSGGAYPINLVRMYKAPYHYIGVGKYVSLKYQQGWSYEADLGVVDLYPAPDNKPIYVYQKYYNIHGTRRYRNIHLVTSNYGELGAGNHEWEYQGIQFYAY